SPKADANRPVYEYSTIADCPDALPGTDSQDVLCSRALRSCPPDTVGPLSAIWRRIMQNGREIQPWERVGITCHTDVAPGAQPRLTMAEITAQFMRTPWAKPQISTQPVGDTTLVNLTTFYEVRWSSAGFEPGEVDRSLLRGIPVSIRPKLVGFTYVFGDGESFGPTRSVGGTYPDGDVTHVYAKPGSYQVRVDTTFGADFSLDGRTWDPIPSTVTVPGPTTTVTVREAKAVLVRE
ncbi:PKD domain-containing protein, partial [Intrasporangium sp.]|uniref:PKD domain-containing protein n=1 Tax=Intrasporangium sp. TaxID=1925024 RepID=UPI0029395766